MQFVAKKAGSDQLIAVETEKMENGVYRKRLAGQALTIKVVE